MTTIKKRQKRARRRAKAEVLRIKASKKGRKTKRQ